MGQPQVIPGKIADMQNRVFGPLTFRDIGFLMASVALSAVTFTMLSGVNTWLAALGAVFTAAIILGVGFIHLIMDIEPLEKYIVTWYGFESSAKEMTWKKEIVDERGYYAANSTQSFFPFNIDQDGILFYHDNGGGALLLKVEGVDYQLLSEAERDVIIATFGDFIDKIKFPIQILIKTTPIDLREYISQAKKDLEKNRPHENLYNATNDYWVFLQQYQSADFIFNKSMYLVLPYTPSGEIAGNQSLGIASAASTDSLKSNSPLNKLFKKNEKTKEGELDLSVLREKEYSKEFTRKTLVERSQVVLSFISGLNGVNSRRATLPEYVELFYYFFNVHESTIRTILDREPTGNLASTSSEYKEIRERASIIQEKKEENKTFDLDELL